MKTQQPKVHFWIERIDRHMVAVHACRAWDTPANGIFVLFHADKLVGTREWPGKRACYEAAENRLIQREAEIYNECGRNYRYGLADMDVWPNAPKHKRARAGYEAGAFRVGS